MGGPCRRCGGEDPGRARCCLACGALLGARVVGAEREAGSVLFVALVAFTARSDAADPEDVRATLQPYHERVREELGRFGGTVEKFVGDAVMAAVSSPPSRADPAPGAPPAAPRPPGAAGRARRRGHPARA